MGLKVPKPPPDYGYGDDCLDCWPAGKTPNYVFVRFWDITACPTRPKPPNGMPFICKQNPAFPCLYEGEFVFEGITWMAFYNSWIFNPAGHQCDLQLWPDVPGGNVYFYSLIGACSVDFDNVLTCVGGFWGEGGHAHVTIYIDPIIIALTSCYHFATIPGVLYEHEDCGMDHAWYKLNHRIDKTNVLIYLDKEHVISPW